ncbi:MAG: class I SAM-dependent methyltransferase [Scytonema sp. PMC 1069.18]|nr:class I SAM-dependent methyltransferase [Scytonema sp. PMC 1069.18]MEC4883146.1 class I SAM-dependent methyltransferase [Scytonema sp. PMC 1070.18]
MQSVGEKTYTQAVKEGKYDLYVGNLSGKYDNIRTYWEDQLTRIALRPFLRELVEHRQQQKRGLRIVDLGCGSGQGYEIITKIDSRDLNLGLQHRRILPKDEIDLYLGLDISQAMVDKGKALFTNEPHIKFAQQDLREGLGKYKSQEAAFDVYYSSYGSLSHLSREELVCLLRDICEHSLNDSLVILDLVGRYSIEWPNFWSAKTETEKVREYTMSYLYPESERKNRDIEKFPLRFWTGEEVQELAKEVSQDTGVKIEIAKLMDRSILVGRHVDTKEYNSKIKPLRSLCNSLHEDYLRTDLQELLIDPNMIPEHSQVSCFLRNLVESWNILVEYCKHRLVHNISLTDLEQWDEFPKSLQFTLMTIDRVIANVGWMWYEDPRANIIEPQLGYALRTLEYEMQQGIGCGHGLVAIFKIKKLPVTDSLN